MEVRMTESAPAPIKVIWAAVKVWVYVVTVLLKAVTEIKSPSLATASSSTPLKVVPLLGLHWPVLVSLAGRPKAVSYTHLTLPTICSV